MDVRWTPRARLELKTLTISLKPFAIGSQAVKTHNLACGLTDVALSIPDSTYTSLSSTWRQHDQPSRQILRSHDRYSPRFSTHKSTGPTRCSHFAWNHAFPKDVASATWAALYSLSSNCAREPRRTNDTTPSSTQWAACPCLHAEFMVKKPSGPCPHLLIMHSQGS